MKRELAHQQALGRLRFTGREPVLAGFDRKKLGGLGPQEKKIVDQLEPLQGVISDQVLWTILDVARELEYSDEVIQALIAFKKRASVAARQVTKLTSDLDTFGIDLFLRLQQTHGEEPEAEGEME